MKRNVLWSILWLMLPFIVMGQSFVNLTPRPKNIIVAGGELLLPPSFAVLTQNLSEEQTAETRKFVENFNRATGYSAILTDETAEALFKISSDPTVSAEGYVVNVTDGGVEVKASTATGLYYAFQTIRKILPPNVMAGVADDRITRYALPLVSISDEPRYGYRGFMLDVSRHFFTVEEVKRMINVMSMYKMNRFHWHLSDDQGWRVEIKKYPRLTTVGSIAPNSRFTSMTEGQYWINKPYGPYFYTREELKEVVAYAKERHIEIIPEIDMPGHFCAAMAAYPEFSCNPGGSHVVWSDGGISSDVMNVANPQAVQFAKDILEELMDIFPYEYLHIGGDECPTSAWEGNVQCQARYRELGLTSYRQLQSLFIKEMADFVKSKGRRLAVWNEAITAGGANLDLMKETGATVYCWTGPEAAARKAKELGLPNIYTPWGPYYINRRQGNSASDPAGAGDGTDNVQKTYNTVPPAETDAGVQGTFWCEHVSDREYMEWLALPRLLAIAEAGWTPQSRKDFTDFQKRMTADTVLLNYGGYRYCKYKMLDEDESVSDMRLPHASTSEKQYWYRLISGGTDATRQGRCIELLATGSPLLTAYAANGAQPGRLWTNVQADENAANYDCQWWSLEEDPSASGRFALVCKAVPEGSVKPLPTVNGVGGRWEYDNSAKHYNFTLGAGTYGQKGRNYYYSIGSNQLAGNYLNSSMGGQGLAVNVYSNPNDGNGGCWEFSPAENYDDVEVITFDHLAVGSTYRFTNAVDGFDATAISDSGDGTALQHSADAFANNAWTVTESTPNADGSQTLKLQNTITGRYIAAAAAYVDRMGFPVGVGTAGTGLVLKIVPATGHFRLSADGRSFFPLPANASRYSGCISSGSTISGSAADAARLQGAEWKIDEVKVITFRCVDDKGGNLGTISRSVPADTEEITAELCPFFKNMKFESIEKTGDTTWNVTYKRSAYAVVVTCKDSRGAIIEQSETAIPVGEEYTVVIPELKYYTLESADKEDGTTLLPVEDMKVTAVYTTEGFSGVRAVAQAVTDPSDLQSGNSYLIYDDSDANNGGRKGYRTVMADGRVNRVVNAEGATPLTPWTLLKTGNGFRVKNEYLGKYIPSIARNGNPVVSSTGDIFAFTLNDDLSWKIQGRNGECWDGQENGNLVGWSAPGHPHKIFTYFVEPYFEITVHYTTKEGEVLAPSETRLVKAGNSHTVSAPSVEGYILMKIEGSEALAAVEGHVTVNVVYEKEVPSGIRDIEDGKVDNTIYDLAGRRLKAVSGRGIYIVNGRKVLLK